MCAHAQVTGVFFFSFFPWCVSDVTLHMDYCCGVCSLELYSTEDEEKPDFSWEVGAERGYF